MAITMNKLLDFLRDAMKEASDLWWRFFDWLAVTEWRRLYLVWVIVFIGMLMHSWWIFGLALAASVVATIAWLWPEAVLGQTMDIVHE